MDKPVIIIGAGGHARVIADILKCQGTSILGALDDKDISVSSSLKILGRISDFKKYSSKNAFIIGIGSNNSRKMIAELISEHVEFATAIHPSAVLADDVVIGDGTVIMAGVVINTGSSIGYHCIINTSSSIDHDCQIGDFVHISPGSHLAGSVSVKNASWIGIGVTVSNNLSISENCIIGAGGVVTRDIVRAGTYVGIPVKMLVESDRESNSFFENFERD